MKEELSDFRSEGELNISPHREAWQEQNIDPVTQSLLEEDAKYFLHQSLSTPCLNVIRRCEGPYLEDLNGDRVLDFHGNSVHQVGFGHPRVITAVKRQLDELPFCTRRFTNLPAIELAKKLTSLAPDPLNKLLFAPGGTSAIGIALKLARMATGRFKTISMWDAFHGASLDAISVGGEAMFRKDAGPLLPGTEHVPPPDDQHCPWDCAGTCKLKCAEYVDYVLAKEGDVCAVVAETVRSIPYFPPKEYWQIVRESCDRHGALLILDEIPHCLGRTGSWFTFENYDVIPDIVVIGKGLGGGVFPLAAILARQDLDIAPERALGHYTHEKNPVACAAGLATLQVIEQEDLLQRSRDLGARALKKLSQLQLSHPVISDVRGQGLLLGIELIYPESGDRNVDLAERVLYKCLTKGLSFKISMGNVLTLAPPLNIPETEMDRAIDIIDKSLLECRSG